MPLDASLVQNVIQMEQKDEVTLKDKFKDMKSQLDLVKQKYEKLSRFQIENFMKETDGQFKVTDSFIEENYNQANIHLREAAKAIEAAEDASFPRERNPYYAAYKEVAAAFRHMFVGDGWQYFGDEIQNFQIDRLFEIVRDTRDTELETQKLEMEEQYRKQFMEHYETALKDRDAQIRALTRRFVDLLDMLRQLGLKIPERQEDEAGEELEKAAFAMPEEKPQLTELEKTSLKVYNTPKAKAKALIESHKDWPDAIISEYSGLPVDNVSLSRWQLELGEKP